ncbi:MAG: TOMM precursor leader peptide-binding protein [Thermodesulfobacteriota bacterium]
MVQLDQGLSEKPVISKNVSIFKRDNETMTILFETVLLNIKGKNISIFIDYILPLLDGKNSVADILSKMEPYLPEESSLRLLSSLREYGIIEHGDSHRLSENETLQYDATIGYYSKWGKDKFDLFESMRRKKVAVVGLSRLGARAALLFTTLGIGSVVLIDDSIIGREDIGSIFLKNDIGKRKAEVVTREIKRMNSVIRVQTALEERLESVIESIDLAVVSGTYEYQNYTLPRKINQLSLKMHKPWIYGSAGQNGECIVGPLFKPLETACYECMMSRLKSNSDMAEEISAYEGLVFDPKTIHSKICFDPHIEIATGFIVNEAWKFLSQLLPVGIASQFYVVSADCISAEPHYVLRVPRCKSCSSVAAEPFRKLWNDDFIEVERMLFDRGQL